LKVIESNACEKIVIFQEKFSNYRKEREAALFA